MSNAFFEQPILNSPYVAPARHWELDKDGQPTQAIVETRRKAEFVTPIPKPKKRKGKKDTQADLPLGDDTGLSTRQQQYESMSIINEIRQAVAIWRDKLKPAEWGVTPETARGWHRRWPGRGIRGSASRRRSAVRPRSAR